MKIPPCTHGPGCDCQLTASSLAQHLDHCDCHTTTTKESTTMTDNAVDLVNHPPHYNMHPSGIECIEVARLCHCDMGAAIQYIWRYDWKGEPVRDLSKARFYLRDILANGLAHFPPWKAKALLLDVIAAETNPLRKYLLARIVDGQLDMAIGAITEFVGSDD